MQVKSNRQFCYGEFIRKFVQDPGILDQERFIFGGQEVNEVIFENNITIGIDPSPHYIEQGVR